MTGLQPPAQTGRRHRYHSFGCSAGWARWAADRPLATSGTSKELSWTWTRLPAVSVTRRPAGVRLRFPLAANTYVLCGLAMSRASLKSSSRAFTYGRWMQATGLILISSDQSRAVPLNEAVVRMLSQHFSKISVSTNRVINCGQPPAAAIVLLPRRPRCITTYHVNSISEIILVCSLKWYISVPVHSGLPF